MKHKVVLFRWIVGLSITCAGIGCGHACRIPTGATTQSVSPGDSIPALVIQRAIEFIASRVGQQFCQDNVRFDVGRSQAHPSLPASPPNFALRHPDLAFAPRYRMVFDLSVPDRPWVESKIEFFLDSQGNLLPDVPVVGLPDCMSKPARCEFAIDRERAVVLAKSVGLEPGLRPWDVSFGWDPVDPNDPQSGVYVWTITSTMSVSELEDRGAIVIIDANSGEIFTHSYWTEKRVPNGP